MRASMLERVIHSFGNVCMSCDMPALPSPNDVETNFLGETAQRIQTEGNRQTEILRDEIRHTVPCCVFLCIFMKFR